MPSVFDGYPYSNTHQLNLDWIIAQISQVQPSLEEMKTILENLKDINAVVEEAKNASEKASDAAESAEEATERINSATVNGVPVVNNPVLNASNVRAVPDSATVNGVPVVNNPVLDASAVGALAKENIRNAFTNVDTNGNPSVDALSAYPTKPGVYRIASAINGLPNGASPYGTLIIFNGGSYVKHIYIDVSKKIFVADTSGGSTDVDAPTSESWVRVINENDIPDMVPDIEYLTMERYKGKPVYRKLVVYTHDGQMGNGSTSTDFEIPHGISNIAQAVRCITVANNDAIFPYVGSTGGIMQTLGFDATNINVRAYKTYFNSPKINFDLAYIKE